jgi:hypothetical protein
MERRGGLAEVDGVGVGVLVLIVGRARPRTVKDDG